MGEINKYGYIGPGYGKEKDTGVVRIALLGDSYIEGFQHFDRNHFRAIMENELREKYSIKAEVMNFGKFGYNLLDMYVLNENYVSEFKPDIVLFMLGNKDFIEEPNKNGFPYPYVDGDSIKINYENAPPEGLPWFLSMNKMGMISPTVQMIRNSLNLHRQGQTSGILLDKFFTPVLDQNKPEDNILTENDSLLSVHIKVIEELSENPGNMIVHRDKYELNENIRASIKSADIRMIELNDTLNDLRARGFDPNYWQYNGNYGHWNIQAHKTIGEFLARKISEYYTK